MKPFALLRFTAVFVLAAVAAGNAEAASRKLLVFTQSKGFVHDPVKRGTNELCLVERTLADIGKESGVFTTMNSQKAEEALTRENLKQADAALFYTTGDLLKPDQDREALIEFVSSGKALIVVHSGMDTYPGFKPYIQMVNGNFDGHPWNAGDLCTFTNHEPAHPVVAMYPAEFQFKDEIYQYRFFEPSAVRVLLSLNMAKNKTQRPWHVPVVWVREYGSGRVFVTNLGHNPSTWRDEKFREHLLAGIRWALKQTDGPSKPNVDVQAIEHAKSVVVFAANGVKRDWTELMSKAATKAKSDPAFLSKLNGEIAAYKQLPEPDPKKAKPEEIEAAKMKKTEWYHRVLASIEN